MQAIAQDIPEPFTQPITLRDQLRHHTMPAHVRIDVFISARFLQLSTTPAIALRLYRGLFTFFIQWENRASAIVDAGLFNVMSSRSKLEMLRSDIHALGGECPDTGLSIELPRMSGTSAVLGSMYVIEGSTLGGKAIAQRLRTLFPQSIPTAYFESYGSSVGKQWREFVEILEHHVPPEDHAQAIAAANATFVAMEKVYVKCLESRS
ncbi:MAG TPA: biliverdin-producing heme oxygenase [Tepidisphaeraceae bacterium]|jgi:heme oxygenase